MTYEPNPSGLPVSRVLRNGPGAKDHFRSPAGWRDLKNHVMYRMLTEVFVIYAIRCQFRRVMVWAVEVRVGAGGMPSYGKSVDHRGVSHDLRYDEWNDLLTFLRLILSLLPHKGKKSRRVKGSFCGGIAVLVNMPDKISLEPIPTSENRTIGWRIDDDVTRLTNTSATDVRILYISAMVVLLDLMECLPHSQSSKSSYNTCQKGGAFCSTATWPRCRRLVTIVSWLRFEIP
jgi:hypothetical protein